MHSKIKAFAFLLSLVLPVALWASTTTDHDSNVDFSKFKTYSFGKGTPMKNQLQQQRLESAIESNMDQKGLQQVEENPDLLVVTHASTKENQRVNATSFGYMGGPGYRGWGGWGYGTGNTMVNVSTVTEGTLIVDLVEAGSNNLVWRGMATGTVSDSPDKMKKKIIKAVNKMFKNYPPN